MGFGQSGNVAGNVEESGGVVMTEAIKRLTSVEALNACILHVEFEDGLKGDVDMSKYINRYKEYMPLRENSALWRQAYIGNWGWGVAWPGNIDMDADSLYRSLLEQTGESMHPADFAEWMEKNRFTYDEAASALGISRRNVAYYKSGKKIIPRYIRLACLGYMLEHRKAS